MLPHTSYTRAVMSCHVKSTSVPKESETDVPAPPTRCSACRRHDTHHAVFQPQHPFYMLLSDTREGGVVPRSTAKVELRMLHSVWQQREELLRSTRPVDRAPGIRLSRTIASSVDDCDAYHNFRVLKEDMVCLEDIKVISVFLSPGGEYTPA